MVRVEDAYFMQMAIAEAAKAGNETWKNPRVGAVVVKNGQVLARGHTHEYGGIHAERDAIGKLTPKQLQGATLYVTLEPCNHYGKQPPCSQAIIDAGIRRVVIAETDPHQLVTGKGIATLQQQNIIVKTGVLKEAAQALNPHYDFFYRYRRPWVTLKQAVSLDYRVAAEKGQRTAITNSAVAKMVHTERGNFQGILIGSQTAIIDNPSLLTTAPTEFTPVRIVLDRRGRLKDNPTLHLLTDGQAPTWIFTENSSLQDQFAKGIRVFYRRTWSINDILHELGCREIQSVYVEGGPTVHQAFLWEGLFEELITYLAPQMLGEKGVPGMESPHQLHLAHQEIKILENNIRIAERKIENV
ncbi:bifunctional diaminohydroxyphosphoribosylaminopyrimidine deaminase/5-amino-6-(5-phosphoribosylamino)uracil reductase RibD [Limosilactobacillus reuteri]|nr:bifunctional diaminohydroxyphosphoribosylaminopyrimidine deaminase/5-amino-6-(5-phosphoribosylamino)uracil reductase RibD [Limosilactobacillus reuteri]QDK48644.1 bifunctional diaminohydroxyphosphoribosylaminopyrimidine deaminase/5-amino-6-(5-phosphoribosylamino)uracil reductase RibD [Limosilactobacillus reuteri]